MRLALVVLALLGLAGIVFGGLIIVRHATGPHAIPFQFENYGGPGLMLAGLLLLCGALYLLSVWPKRV